MGLTPLGHRPRRQPARRPGPWRPRAALALLAAVVAPLSGCVTIEPARLAPPAGLASVPAVTIEGIGPGQRGVARLGTLSARFERGASRLELFERLQVDRASVAIVFDDDGSRVSCRLRGETLTRGILHLPLRNAAFGCDLVHADGRAMARLEMAGAAQPGRRRGTLSVNGETVEVRSAHELEGSPLALEAPAGYVFVHRGRHVGALEVTTPRPRLWLAGGEGIDDTIRRTALALALVWDPQQD